MAAASSPGGPRAASAALEVVDSPGEAITGLGQSTPRRCAICSSPTFHLPDLMNWITHTRQPRATPRITTPKAAVDLPLPSPVLSSTSERGPRIGRRLAGGSRWIVRAAAHRARPVHADRHQRVDRVEIEMRVTASVSSSIVWSRSRRGAGAEERLRDRGDARTGRAGRYPSTGPLANPRPSAERRGDGAAGSLTPWRIS